MNVDPNQVVNMNNMPQPNATQMADFQGQSRVRLDSTVQQYLGRNKTNNLLMSDPGSPLSPQSFNGSNRGFGANKFG